MSKVLFASLAMAGLAWSGAAMAQDSAVSEDEARCFVSGVCKVEAEKKFSLANISTKGGKPAAAAPNAPASRPAAPAATRPSRPNGTVGRPPRRTPAPVASSTRQSLDMRLTFELGSDQLTPAARGQADIFAKVLNEAGAGGGRFLIEGHTDSIGSRADNLLLSRRRADSVVAYLVDHGVPASKLQAQGYGFSRPRAGLSASDASNRRVEIVRN